MITKNPKIKINYKIKKNIKVKGKDNEALLYNFLEEFLYLLDAEDFLLNEVETLVIDEKKFDFTHDVDVLVRIADEFSPPERKVAWEKAGNQIVESWDDVYTILVLAAESDFDTVEISLLTSNQKNLQGFLFHPSLPINNY